MSSSSRLFGVAGNLVLAVGMAGTPTIASQFSELIVFGDSISDTGNFAPGVGEHHYGNRGSNGPLWVEELALQLDAAQPLPSNEGGTNYARGGARTGFGIDHISGYSIPTVGAQIEEYLSINTPASDRLYVLLAGDNDFELHHQTNPSLPAVNLSAHISRLAQAGAQYFLVSNLSPQGNYPGFFGTAREKSLNALTVAFNDLLATELDNLISETELTLFWVDLYSLVQEVIDAPSAFGFSNVTDRALVDDVVVPNPDEYLYWDNYHFTTTFHKLFGERAALVVPEPSGWALLLVGLLPWLFVRRSRRWDCAKFCRR